MLRRTVNRRGQAITLAYDALHRQRSRSGAQIVGDTVAYSTDARIVTATNAAASITTYLGGPRRQVDSVRTVLAIPGQGDQTYWHRYTYRWNGLLDSVHATGRGGAVFTGRKYGYETTTLALDSIRLGGALTRVVLNETGQPVVIRMPGIDSLRTTYVPARNVASSTSRVLNDSYHYNWQGRVDQQVTPAGSSDFSYDSLGRLTSRAFGLATNCGREGPQGYHCDTSADSVHEYWYDEVGNRTTSLGRLWNHTVLWSALGSYGTGNRITAFGDCSYATDNDGNDTLRSCPSQTVRFRWSGDGRLTSAAVAGGDSVAFAYDPLGRLVRRDVNGSVSTNLLWEGENLFAELDAAGWISSTGGQYSYYPGLDRLHAFMLSSQKFYAHQDALGNVRGLTDGAGNVPRTYQYDEFGELVGGTSGFGSGVLDRARWKGALYLAPEADLYYMRSRWYEPRTGRFLSEDPIGLDGGINPYAFAGSDPVNRADPEGLDGCYVLVGIYRTWTDGIPGPWGYDYEWRPDGSPECGGGTSSRPGGPGPRGGPGAGRGGRGGGGARQGQQNQAAPYTVLRSCPPVNQSLRRQVEEQYRISAAEDLERGGPYVGPWARVSVRMTATNRTWDGLRIPLGPAGTLGYYHVHQNYPHLPQGPSIDDVTFALARRAQHIVMSADSLFFISPRGEAVGCAR